MDSDILRSMTKNNIIGGILAVMVLTGLVSVGSYLRNSGSVRVNGELAGDAITQGIFFKKAGNGVYTINSANDFWVGNAASTSATFAVDPGLNLVTATNLTVSGTCTGCGTGTGADTDIPFITLGNTSSLSFERSLAVDTNNFTLTDGGANSTYTVGLAAGLTIPVMASVSAWEGFYDTPSGRITAGSGFAWSTNTFGAASGYSMPLTASQSAWEGFYDTPSGRITAGTNLSWAGNTLNATAGGVASNSLGFGALTDTLILDANTTITGGGFALTFDHASVSGNFELAAGSQFSGAGLADCNGNGSAVNWDDVTRLFSCKTIADADVPDTITLSGGTISSNNISGTLTTTGSLTIGDGGDSIIVNSSNWDVDTNGAFTGVTGLTMTGNLVASTTTASHSFGGTIEGPSDGTLSIGTVLKKLKAVFSNIGRFFVELQVPSGAGGTTVDTAGEVTVDTASGSFNFHDGTGERVLDPTKCVAQSLAFSDLTSKNQWTIYTAEDAYTLVYVQATASGSNALGWGLRVGSATVPSTNIFSVDRSASGSAVTTYSTFANSALGNGEKLDIVVGSTSATLDSVYIKACMRKNP